MIELDYRRIGAGYERVAERVAGAGYTAPQPPEPRALSHVHERAGNASARVKNFCDFFR